MELESYEIVKTVCHTLHQIQSGLQLIEDWNRNVASVDDYVTSSEGMQKLAATCMMLESFGESCKKIDKLLPGFLVNNVPEYPWKELKGLRDVIAHGYFRIDAELIFTIVQNELKDLEKAIEILLVKVEEEI